MSHTVEVPFELIETLEHALEAPGMPGARHIVQAARAVVDAVNESLSEKIDELHGPGAAAAIDAAFKDGSIFGD